MLDVGNFLQNYKKYHNKEYSNHTLTNVKSQAQLHPTQTKKTIFKSIVKSQSQNSDRQHPIDIHISQLSNNQLNTVVSVVQPNNSNKTSKSQISPPLPAMSSSRLVQQQLVQQINRQNNKKRQRTNITLQQQAEASYKLAPWTVNQRIRKQDQQQCNQLNKIIDGTAVLARVRVNQKLLEQKQRSLSFSKNTDPSMIFVGKQELSFNFDVE